MSAERIPIQATSQLMQMMTEYYFTAKLTESTGKFAWITSGGPVELLYASGVTPLYPENHAALCGAQKVAVDYCVEAEEHGYSRDICSYARTDFGAIYKGNSPVGGLSRPQFLLCCNNICGTVTKWYQNLQRHFDVPLLFLDTPFIHDEVTPEAIQYVRAQLVEIVERIGEITGTPIDFDNLRQTCRLASRATILWGEVLELLAHKPSPATSLDTFIHIAAIVVMRGTQKCVDYYETLLAEMKERVANNIAAVPGEKYRLGWDNLPIWFKMGALGKKFAEHQACLVAATYASAWAHPIDPDVDDILAEMARAYLTVYINCGLMERQRTLQRMVAQYDLDGVVMHSDRSCKAYSLGQYELGRTLRDELNIPVLMLEADMNDSRVYADEQINARIDAFMETIAARK